MLLRAGLREFSRRKVQTTLAFLGIAVGAAVVVAIDTASSSVRRGFEISNQTVNGKATHRIQAARGDLNETLYVSLKRSGERAALAPFVTGRVSHASDATPSLRVLGIDPLSDGAIRGYLFAGGGGELEPAGDPFGVFVTKGVAQRLGVTKGSELTVESSARKTTLRINDVFTPSESLHREALNDALIMDIALAQHVLGMRGRLSHIDVISEDAATLKAALPPEALLVTTGSATRAQRSMLKAFDTNLLALSLLALLIGLFLIYNTMTFSVVSRRQSIGMLRAIGATRKEVFRQIMNEALLLGTIASLFGIALGVLLANFLVTMLTQTVSDLYFKTEVATLNVSVLTLARGWFLGVLATLAAAAVPAFEATHTPPRAVMSRSDLEQNAGRWARRAGGAGIGLVLLAVVALLVPVKSLLPAFAGLFFLITGVALLIPGMVTPCVARLVPLMRRLLGLEGVMGARYVMRSTSRTGVAVAALAVAVSATMGVGIMIGSFRISVIDWLDTRLRSDIYLSVAADASLPPDFISALHGLDEVRSVGTGRRTVLVDETRRINLFALKTSADAFEGYVPSGYNADALWSMFNEKDAVLISEPFASRFRLAAGDSLALPTVKGSQEFKIAAVYKDYGSDQGVVLMDRSSYTHWFDDATVGAAALKLLPGADVDAVRRRLDALPDRPPLLDVFSNRDLKDESLQVFDRTFAVTDVLRLLAIVVASLGIVSSLMALQFERARDFAVLRAVGVTPTQVAKIATSETLLLGTAAGLAAVPLGVLTALILVHVINERSFGWSMQFHPHVELILQGVGLAVVAALVAGVVPTWRLLRQAPAVNLRNE